MRNGGEQSPSKGGDGTKVSRSCPQQQGLSRHGGRCGNSRFPRGEGEGVSRDTLSYLGTSVQYIFGCSGIPNWYTIRAPWISGVSKRSSLLLKP